MRECSPLGFPVSDLPQRCRTYRALRKAREFLIRSHVTKLPIQPQVLYDMYGWGLYSKDEARSIFPGVDFLRKGIEARTVRHRETGAYITVYDETVLPERILFTLAHEIGHIEMGHLVALSQRDELLTALVRPVVERESDKFAAELLAPTAVLRALGLTNPAEIARVCGLSTQASRNRARELAWYCDTPMCLEMSQDMRDLFSPFISNLCSVAR